jgi:hypothetical protein
LRVLVQKATLLLITCTALQIRRIMRMSRTTLRCDVPIGLAAAGLVDPLGVPEIGECMMLIAVLGIFFAAGRSMFETWGKPGAADAMSVPQGLSVDKALAT